MLRIYNICIKLAFKVSCLVIQNRLSFSEDKKMNNTKLLTGIQIMLAGKIQQAG